MVPMKKDNEQAGGRYQLMQEMRISQLVLDPTSHVDSKNTKARSSPWCGESQSSFFTLVWGISKLVLHPVLL